MTGTFVTMRRLVDQADKKKVSTSLGLFAVLGLGLAMAGASVPRPAVPTGETILWVNDRPVTRDQLSYAEKRLTDGSVAYLSEAERRLVIELLIDEELLLQRAEGLGVLEKDPGVRKVIVHAAISEIVDDFLARPIDRKTLERFYQAHSAVFERPARVAVSVLRFKGLAAAEAAKVDIAGGARWADIAAAQEARRQLPRLPGSPLPPHVLRRYLGPGLADVALSLEPGEISAPVEKSGSVFLLKVTAVLAATTPEFNEIDSVVREEYLSRGREAALAEKLAKLWQAADIEFNARVAGELAVKARDYPKRARVTEADLFTGEYRWQGEQ